MNEFFNKKELKEMNVEKHFTQKEIKEMSPLERGEFVEKAIYEVEPRARIWKFCVGATSISTVFGVIGDVNGFFCTNDGKIQHYLSSEEKAIYRMVWELANKKIKFIEFNGKAV